MTAGYPGARVLQWCQTGVCGGVCSERWWWWVCVAARRPEWIEDVDARITVGLDVARARGVAKPTSLVVVVTGWRAGTGYTNTVRVLRLAACGADAASAGGRSVGAMAVPAGWDGDAADGKEERAAEGGEGRWGIAEVEEVVGGIAEGGEGVGGTAQ